MLKFFTCLEISVSTTSTTTNSTTVILVLGQNSQTLQDTRVGVPITCIPNYTRCSFDINLRNTYTSILIITIALLFNYLWFKCNLLLLCGDVELNPRPNQNTAKEPSICHWNLNSVAAHDFAKLVLFKAFNSIHKFDIICLSEIYLDSSVLCNDSNLEVPGYNLVCSDHLSNKKCGGVCIYYKSYLPSRIIDIYYSNECVRFKLMVEVSKSIG